MSKKYQMMAEEPRTNAELNIKTAVADMRKNEQETYRKIKSGRFITVYYVEGDEDRAVAKFVGVNYDNLSDLPDMSKKLYTTLPVEMVRMIKDELTRVQKMRSQAHYLLFIARWGRNVENEGTILYDPRFEMVPIDLDECDEFDE